MAVLANVALTNTFDTWRLRTNALLSRVNQFTINESALYANTLTANVRFVSTGSTRLGTTGSNRTIVNGLLTANGNLNVAGNTTISGNITVNGGINLGDATTDLLTITGRATIGTNLTVSGNTTIGGAGKVANATGWFGVTGRQSISTNLFVGGNTFVSGLVGIGTIAPTSDAIAKFIHINDATSSGVVLQAARKFSVYSSASSSFVVRDETGAKPRLTIDSNGLVTACNSLTVTNTLTSGNTTLNGTTTDKSNALNQTLTDAATIAWDTSLGRVATVTLGGNRTMGLPTNLKVGTYILRVRQDATGGRTLAWNAAFKWTAQTAPTLTTTASAVDVFSFFSDGSLLYGSFLPDVR
jgi:hypothetical protein